MGSHGKFFCPAPIVEKNKKNLLLPSWICWIGKRVLYLAEYFSIAGSLFPIGDTDDFGFKVKTHFFGLIWWSSFFLLFFFGGPLDVSSRIAPFYPIVSAPPPYILNLFCGRVLWIGWRVSLMFSIAISSTSFMFLLLYFFQHVPSKLTWKYLKGIDIFCKHRNTSYSLYSIYGRQHLA